MATVPNLPDLLRCPTQSPMRYGAEGPEWEDIAEAAFDELKRVWSRGGRMTQNITI